MTRRILDCKSTMLPEDPAQSALLILRLCSNRDELSVMYITDSEELTFYAYVLGR
jgi:hypothetical protein